VLTIIRKPWFGIASAAMVAVAAGFLPSERTWLLGLAAFGALCGAIDWLFRTPGDDVG
jgi:hypothetical protein